MRSGGFVGQRRGGARQIEQSHRRRRGKNGTGTNNRTTWRRRGSSGSLTSCCHRLEQSLGRIVATICRNHFSKKMIFIKILVQKRNTNRCRFKQRGKVSFTHSSSSVSSYLLPSSPRVQMGVLVRDKSVGRQIALPFGASVVVGKHVGIRMFKLLQIGLDLRQKLLCSGSVCVLFEQSTILRNLIVPGHFVHCPGELQLQNTSIRSLLKRNKKVKKAKQKTKKKKKNFFLLYSNSQLLSIHYRMRL